MEETFKCYRFSNDFHSFYRIKRRVCIYRKELGKRRRRKERGGTEKLYDGGKWRAWKKGPFLCRSNEVDGNKERRRRPRAVDVPHGRWDSPWFVLGGIHLSHLHNAFLFLSFSSPPPPLIGKLKTGTKLPPFGLLQRPHGNNLTISRSSSILFLILPPLSFIYPSRRRQRLRRHSRDVAQTL